MFKTCITIEDGKKKNPTENPIVSPGPDVHNSQELRLFLWGISTLKSDLPPLESGYEFTKYCGSCEKC